MNHRGVMVGLAVVIVCTGLNIAGIRVVATTSIWLFFLLSAPFAIIVLLAPFKYGALAHAVTTPTTVHVDIIGGLLISMWNYMGWDNASTIALEVERPQRTYPRAMLAAVALVAISYILPVAAMSLTHLSPAAWETGSWAEIAGLLGGPLLRIGFGAGRNDECVWHVQCAGHELFALAAGHGSRRYAASRLRQDCSRAQRLPRSRFWFWRPDGRSASASVSSAWSRSMCWFMARA